MDFRHELKFLVPDLTLEKLRLRLEAVMRYDDNQGEQYYTIRSLYFDDLHDRCLAENKAGLDRRHKYRIRLYNGNTDYINLEKKSKINGMTQKKSEWLGKSMVEPYIEGTNELTKGDLTTALFALQVKDGMRPKCIVEYDRLAFVEDVGNVRITFDTNVRGSMEVERFLDFNGDYMMPVLPTGMHILEIKYDELLPRHIRQLVDIGTLQHQSISKYALVRQAF